MTKNEAKQKVLDAVADLAEVQLDSTGDYLHFLGEVETAVADRITTLARQEVERALGYDLTTVADVNLTRDEADEVNRRAAERAEGDDECCGFGCGSACTGIGRASHDTEDELTAALNAVLRALDKE